MQKNPFWALFAQFFWKINFWDFFMFLDFYCCAKFLKKKFDFKVHPEGIPKLLVAKTYLVGSNPKVLYKNWKFWAILVIFYAKTKNQTIWLIEKKPRKNPEKTQHQLNSVLTYCNLTLEITLDMSCEWTES